MVASACTNGPDGTGAPPIRSRTIALALTARDWAGAGSAPGASFRARRFPMRRLLAILSSVGVALVLCTPVQATSGWSSPAMVWNGDLSQPSMVMDSHGRAYIAARGDTGIWYLTNKTGTWTRTRLTRDGANAYGKVTDSSPHIALDRSDGSLTIVYTRTVPRDYTPEWTMHYVTNRSGHWSSPRDIPGDWAQSVLVRNGTIAIATPVVDYCCVGGFDCCPFPYERVRPLDDCAAWLIRI